jgi:hypothetical protein
MCYHQIPAFAQEWSRIADNVAFGFAVIRGQNIDRISVHSARRHCASDLAASLAGYQNLHLTRILFSLHCGVDLAARIVAYMPPRLLVSNALSPPQRALSVSVGSRYHHKQAAVTQPSPLLAK